LSMRNESTNEITEFTNILIMRGPTYTSKFPDI